MGEPVEAHKALTAEARLLARRITVSGVGVALCLSAPAPAFAEEDPKGGAEPCRVQSICVGAEDQESSSPASGKPAPPETSKSKVRCKVTKVESPPPASHPVWKGNNPKKGSLFFRACTDGSTSGEDGFIYVPDGRKAPAANPNVVAQKAVDEMALRGPRITMSPKPDGKGVLGMPVWMAVDESSKERFGPNTATASAGGVTVEATARVSQVVWKMGDGTTRSCSPAQMKPYKKSYGLADSSCGHRYRELPENAKDGRGTYKVSATAHWEVEWEVQGGGESGTLAESRTSEVDVNMGEAQVVN